MRDATWWQEYRMFKQAMLRQYTGMDKVKLHEAIRQAVAYYAKISRACKFDSEAFTTTQRNLAKWCQLRKDLL